MDDQTYECLECGVRWGSTDVDEEEISHGFCRRCLRELMKKHVWNNQMRQGFNQCYAQGYDDCQQYECSHRDNCLEYIIQQWEKENVNGKRKGNTNL